MDHLTIARNTLTGDLRDLVLTILRDRHGYKAYRDLSEDEQVSAVVAIENEVYEAVARAVELIASSGFPVFQFGVEAVQVKKDLRVLLTAPREGRQVAAAARWYGGPVVVVPVSLEQFTGERGPAAVDRDQPALELEDQHPRVSLELDPQDELPGEDHPVQYPDDMPELDAPDFSEVDEQPNGADEGEEVPPVVASRKSRRAARGGGAALN